MSDERRRTEPGSTMRARDVGGDGPPPGGHWDMALERGPDWLFVRLDTPPRGAADDDTLTDRICAAVREHHTRRVVLELERVERLDEPLIGTIADVGRLVRERGGLIRICGLSGPNLARLRSSPAAGDVPHFESRAAAVVGDRNGTVPCG